MIRVALVDVDGCLTDGEGSALDLKLLADVAEVNRRSRVDPQTPAVTLCTGRPAPYVEVLHQAIGGWLPAIFENGCGLFVPRPYGFHKHPSLTREREDAFRAASSLLRERLVSSGDAYFQPGKEFSATLYPLTMSVHELFLRARDLAGDAVYLDEAVTCINLMPVGMDKGVGAAWLAQETGIGLDEMAGIGDSDADLVFLERVGLAAAPANATRNVRRRAAYVSKYPTGRGLLDLLRIIADRNRSTREQRSASQVKAVKP